ncbi:HAD-superfamily subfamily IB hydrolase, TIGR01490 [Pseudomonas lundensis]|jgi:HAD superfamily hydrolase (TIGR01490 family)|uniref:HAD family hydrolase n=1 Tax=Pseudomonas lundensis TaxID=86185 RepID=A0AAX2H1U5_9PSED|nr:MULTISPECIES: HAD family hydrolase [Pseudomonas]MBM1183049.1 HAD family hydrolase [Pseudomonas lundensis]MBS5840305.1 HAD family hydrolase [Pseudomonas sp.]QOF90045.1 HAD family hydrolase [Pseudomonas lundensis]QVQ79189.1 HAD family hydrolase [Pseudomonas lundensis]QVQ81752.1 HAD family hydrolase [Pseudomonas lundensis]
MGRLNNVLNKPVTNKQVLSAFDFDGTLTYHDSFVPFLRFAFGNRLFAMRLFRMIPATLSYLLGQISRNDLKEKLITVYLTGAKVAWVEERAEAFCDVSWQRLMRPLGLTSVAHQREQQALVTICSASPELVLKPFAKKLGIGLIGTQLEAVNGVLTGEISGTNCRCEQKVIRLEAQYGPLDQYTLRAWGDTRGDEQMLGAAQEPHWREFHALWRRKRPLDVCLREEL